MVVIKEPIKTKLREEAEKRVKQLGGETLCLVVSGAHMFGFPSENSDWDVRGLFAHPTKRFLGFQEPQTSYHEITDSDGMELDFVFKEIKPFLRGLAENNGNYLEKLFSPLVLETSPEHEEMKGLARGVISKKLHDFYANFAQHVRIEGEKTGNLKNFLYAARLYMAGEHILRTGEIVQSLVDLNRDQPIGLIDEMIEAKKSRELQAFQGNVPHLRGVLDSLQSKLDGAAENSYLPEAPSEKDIEALENYLVSFRGRK